MQRIEEKEEETMEEKQKNKAGKPKDRYPQTR
jgi:hypothetical protein